MTTAGTAGTLGSLDVPVVSLGVGLCFRRCFSAARPPRTERGAEEMRGKVEASIGQPRREQ